MNELVEKLGGSGSGKWLGKRLETLPSWRSAWGAILAVLVALVLFDPARLGEHLTFAARALAGTFPYIAVAVAMIAMLKASGAERTLAKIFEGREYRMIVLAALFGGLAPFCSCEVVPFVAGLIAAGAPLSAIMAFWLSSPLIDPPTLVITAAALGWNFAIAKAVFAVAIGLMGGVAIAALVRTGMFANPASSKLGSTSSCGADPLTGKPVWRFWEHAERREVFFKEAGKNAIFLIKWLALAYLLEAILIAYVPAQAIGALVGGEGILPIIISALVGAPAYLNSYVAPPLVAGLMGQGMSAGAAMAFMIAGAVSSIPAMVAVYSLVRVPVFAAYVTLGLLGAVLSGVAFTAIL